jgi:hypothetical protein
MVYFKVSQRPNKLNPKRNLGVAKLKLRLCSASWRSDRGLVFIGLELSLFTIAGFREDMDDAKASVASRRPAAEQLWS